MILQSPNFFGLLEQVKEIGSIVRATGALLVVVFTEAVALGLIEPPREADIVVGELQSFAISPSYGGPYVGIIATRENISGKFQDAWWVRLLTPMAIVLFV